jgi:hypothetical protein
MKKINEKNKLPYIFEYFEIISLKRKKSKVKIVNISTKYQTDYYPFEVSIKKLVRFI